MATSLVRRKRSWPRLAADNGCWSRGPAAIGDWDASPIHRNRAVKAVPEQAEERIWLESLPGYAPDLNPDEGVWHHPKHVTLANV